jgi:hypothetical protein
MESFQTLLSKPRKIQAPLATAKLAAVAGLVALSLFVSAYKSSDVMTDVETDVHTFAISGRVVDQKQKPMNGVSVLLWESAGDLSMECTSNGAGEFKFLHKPCGDLCLEVKPDRGLKLASAFIENLPGGETRKMIVELKGGYLVTGRVTHAGKGLKGLIVRVTPTGAIDKRTKVHGGGADETGRGGVFNLILTGGEKKLLVINDKYPQFSRHVESAFTVIDDTHLGKIELP